MNPPSDTQAGRGIGRYVSVWDRFWFTPRLPHVLSALRIITGLMLLYSQLVLATDLGSFLGDDAWINNDTARQLHDGSFGPSDLGRSYLWHIHDPTVLAIHHAFTILVTFAFAVGFLSRLTVPLAFALQLIYLHRLSGTLFGLDQIVTYMTMYLMISPSGSSYSVDAWLRKKWSARRSQSRSLQWLFPAATPSVAANIATRLLQIHLCVIYLFGGLAKARGETWWDGTAIWYAVGIYEYQSMDMTWLAGYPRLFTAMTHATLFWEIFYCALVWPKLTRPMVLAVAVIVHGGIAMSLGMITFGGMMIAANMIFVEPQWFLALVSRGRGRAAGVEQQPAAETVTEPGKKSTASRKKPRTMKEREQRVRLAGRRVKEKSRKLKEREERYRGRVKRLKEREAKIKRLIQRRRKAKESRDTEADQQ